MTRSSRSRLHTAPTLATAALLCLFAPAAKADQTVSVRNGGSVAADISLDAPTRLFFDGDGAAQLIFNSVTGEPPEIAATVGETGDVYLTVVSGAPGQGVTGFLTTQAGHTYKVDFTIAATEAEQIEIVSLDARDALMKAKAIEAAEETALPAPLKWTRSAGHHRAVAALLRVVHQGGVPTGMRKARAGEARPPKINGLKVERVHGVVAADVEALRLRVTNLTGAQMSSDTLRRHFAPYVGYGQVSGHLPAGATTEIVLLRETES